MSATVHLFTDIEGSTRLWEREPERMRVALALHDGLARQAVQSQHGRVVKTTGDGVHAVFDDALDAVLATHRLLQALADGAGTGGLPLAVRCGIHAGADEARDNDFYGRDVNRAARIMAAAHGGQVLVSQWVADALAGRLPDGLGLKDLGPVRLRDLERPEHLHQLLAPPPLRQDFPPLRSLEATPNNLPPQTTRFIGRAHELAALAALVREHPLVTLWGPGGIGKSRLSLQLAAELLEGFADGVWLVELAAITDAEQLPQAVAAVLGVKEAPGQPLLAALLAHLRERRLLLVLDNCEHVHDAAAALAKALLRAGPGLRLLASSREVLRIAGEHTWAVPALSAPAPGAVGDLAALRAHEAVRLFADRAAAVAPAFRVDAANAAAVADICHRLDGIPLAIELAAARVRALPVATLAERLRGSFALVATKDATVAPRQRTLRLLIDWSHDLLDADERRLYRRLSVFAGGFSLEAAEQVCADGDADAGADADADADADAGGPLATDQVADLLVQLVEKSLVSGLADASGGIVRHRLLATVRQHAAERLAGDEPAVAQAALAQRHAEWAAALADTARPQLAGPAQAEWLLKLDAERDNLLAALAWCARVPDGAAALGLRLSFALRPYWINRGLATLGLATTRAVLAHPGAAARDGLRARGLFDAGQLCSFAGRYAEALQHLGDSLTIAREIGDVARQAAVLQPMGMAALGIGDHAAARRYGEDAIAAARALGNPRTLAGAFNALAQLERTEGRLDAAEALYREFLALARALEDAEYVAIGLLNLAMVALARAHGAAVAPMLTEVVAIAEDNGSRPVALCALDVGAALAAQQGDWACAVRWFAASEAQNRQAGLQRDAADEAFFAPTLAAARQALGADAFAADSAAGRAAGFDLVWAELKARLAEARPLPPPAP